MSRQYPLFTQEKVERMRRLVGQYGITTAAEIMGTSPNAIRRVRKRGWTVARRAPPVRQIPSDFAIQADTMTLHELARHYSAGCETISKWAAHVGRKPMTKPRRLQPPGDLAALVRQHGPLKAARVCGVSEDTMLRWRREAGLPTGKAKPAPKVGWAERYAAEHFGATA